VNSVYPSQVTLDRCENMTELSKLGTTPYTRNGVGINPLKDGSLLTVYFGAPSMFIALWFGFDYGTNPPLGTLII
jgi:hypothetical protein